MNNADDFETPEELTLPLRALPESDDEPTQALTAPRSRRKRLVGGIVAGALALTLTVGGFSVAAAHKAVTVSADGALVETGTFTGTVEALLAEQGIEVGEYDEVTPALDSQLADGLEIEVHDNPQCAWSDGAQCLKPEKFAETIANCRKVAAAIGREM